MQVQEIIKMLEQYDPYTQVEFYNRGTGDDYILTDMISVSDDGDTIYINMNRA